MSNNRASWVPPPGPGQVPYHGGPHAHPSQYGHPDAPAQSPTHLQGQQPYRPYSDLYEQAPPLPSRTPIQYMNAPSLPPRPHSTNATSRPISAVPVGYQTEVQQSQQGWPQHAAYSSEPPSHRYEPHNPGGHMPSTQAPPIQYYHEAPKPPPKVPGHSVTPNFGARPPGVVDIGTAGYQSGGYHQAVASTSDYVHQGYPATPVNGTQLYHQSPSQNARPPDSLINSNYPIPSVLPGPPPGPPPATGPRPGQANVGYAGTGHASTPYPESDFGPGVTHSTGSHQMDPRAEQQYDPVSPLHKASIDSGHGSSISLAGISSPPSRSASLVSRMSSATPFKPPVSPQVDPNSRPALKHAHNPSAFNFGGPLDWQHYGQGEDEIDDTELYGAKSHDDEGNVHESKPAELPAASPPLALIKTDVPEGQHDMTHQLKTPTARIDQSRTDMGRHGRYQSSTTVDHFDQRHTDYPDGTLQQHRPDVELVKASEESVIVRSSANRTQEDRGQAIVPTVDRSRELFLQGRIDELQKHNDYLKSMLDELREEMTTSKDAFENHEVELASLQKSMSEAYQQLDTKGLELAELRVRSDGDLRSAQAQLTEARSAAASMKEDLEKQIAQLRSDVDGKESQMQSLNDEHEKSIAPLRVNAVAAEKELGSLKSELELLRAKEQEHNNKLDALRLQMETEKDQTLRVPDGLDTPLRESMQRYLEALTAEADANSAQEKLKIFQDFMSQETRLRGIEPPLRATHRGKPSTEIHAAPATDEHNFESKALKLAIPAGESSGGSEEYSPGGRPVFVAPEQYSPGGRPLMKSFAQSAHPRPDRPESNTQAIPAPKSAGPSGPQPQSSFVAYRPGGFQTDQSPPPKPSREPGRGTLVKSDRSQHSRSETAITPPRMRTEGPIGTTNHEAKAQSPSAHAPIPIEFDEPTPNAPRYPPSQRPAPATVISSRPAQPAKLNDSQQSRQRLEKLLSSTTVSDPHFTESISRFREKMANYTSDFTFIQSTTKTWEAKANEKRMRLEAERRKRVEQEEQRISELYDNHEIGYADIGILEDKSKAAEAANQASEERTEYESYANEVFQPTYDRISKEIMSVVADYQALETVIQKTLAANFDDDDKADSSSSLLPADMPTALDLIIEISHLLELRHKHLNSCIAERDRRYRRTQVRPLYASGQVQEMKKLERSFDIGERRAMVKAAVAAADRCKRLWSLVDEVTSQGVERNESFMKRALHAFQDATEGLSEGKDLNALREKVKLTIQSLLTNSTALFARFTKMEAELNDVEFGASLAQIRLEALIKNENVEAAREAETKARERLIGEKEKEDKRLEDEAKKRVSELEGGVEKILKEVTTT